RCGFRGWLARECRIAAAGPADTAFDQIMKTGIAPGAMVVAPGCVEHAARALRADPSPRLALVARGLRVATSILQYDAILLIMQVMHIRLIPAAERIEPIENRMRFLGQFGRKHSGSVPPELR